MSIRCVALDLDETTLDENSRLSPATEAVLGELSARGVELVFASGRALGTYPRELLTFPGVRYAITSNGAAIMDLRRGEAIYRHCLTPEAVEAILAVSADYPVTYETFLDGIGYADADYVRRPEAYGAYGRTADYIRTTRIPTEDILGFIRSHADRLDAIDLIVTDPAARQNLWQALEGCGAPLYLTTSAERLIEISHAGGGKGTALAFLLERLGIPAAECAAFGNGDNDAPMLEAAGIGIAVANASPLCIKAADYVTLDYREEGVAHALRELLGCKGPFSTIGTE